MRMLLIRILDLVRRGQALWMRLRGQTPEGIAEQRIVSGQAWEEYCDTLKAAGASLKFPGAPQDPFHQAEGYRYLSRLVRAGLEGFLEDSDPHAPVLKRTVHETVKMGADNPDNHYQNAGISGACEYRIRGNRGTVAYLAFATQAGHYGQGGGLPPTGALEASQLELDADGNFEIAVSCEPRPGNWLPMQPETGLLIVRQTFLDRATEKLATLTVERVDGPGQPVPVTAASVDAGLRNASTLVAGASLLFAKWARDFQKHSNELPQFDPAVSNAAGGDPNIAYYHSHWRLGPDEALVIDVVPPVCEYWNFQLNNYWMESLDYRFFRIHTNKHLATANADGSVRIVVAHSDPGHPNWIQTVGHDCGTMCFRWVRADAHPVPRTRVVCVAEAAALPA
ncbi:MAG: DUF1214 domain-containing protein [Candidatus Binatia bacterium]